VDTQGRVAIPPKFDEARSFSDGLAQARLDDKWGYIDRSGDWIIKRKFDSEGPFVDGLAYIEPVDGKGWGYIDRRAHMVIKPQYEDSGDFSEGLAPVANEEGDYYIDKIGRRVEFASIGLFDLIAGRNPGAGASYHVEYVAKTLLFEKARRDARPVPAGTDHSDRKLLAD
jgi:hypothetical protein